MSKPNISMSLLLGRVCSSHVCQVRWTRFLTPAATICSDQWLKMDKYLEQRGRTKSRFGDNEDSFSSKMRKFADPADPGMIFSDDIKNYLHLIENKPEDLDVLKKVLIKYATQNSLRFQTFSLGPVISRVLLYVKNVELAMDIIKEEKLSHMFNQSTSYAIISTLLYREQKYTEAIQLWDLFTQQSIEGQRWPPMLTHSLAAACYRLNTSEAHEKLSAVYADMLKAGVNPMIRLRQLVAGLAVKQKDPVEALEVLAEISRPNYYAIVNLKLMALSDAGRVKEALDMLQDKYKIEATKAPPSVFKETVEAIKSALEKSDETTLKSQFSALEPQLKIDEGNIDDLLCADMTANRDPQDNRGGRGDDRGREGRFDDRRFDDRSDRRFDDRSDRRFDRDDRRFERRQQYSDDGEPRYKLYHKLYQNYNRRQAYGSVEQSVRDNYSRQNTGSENY